MVNMLIKLLQWNIWYKENYQHILNFLKRINADIICLEEVTTTSLFNDDIDIPEVLAKGLNYNYYYKEAQHWVLDEDRRNMGNIILSKFEIKKIHSQFLREKIIDVAGKDFEGRVYIEAGLLINDKELTVGSTHLSYFQFFEIEDGKIEVENLLEILRTKKERFIFAADLNSSPESFLVSNLLKHFVNAGPDLEINTWTTKPFKKGSFVANDLNWRLDYIFVTPDIEIKKAKVIHTEFSDHLPVLVEFEM